MKFLVRMTDNDGGFIQIEVEAENWELAVEAAEKDHLGWEAIDVITLTE